jgi:hypothetical protein
MRQDCYGIVTHLHACLHWDNSILKAQVGVTNDDTILGRIGNAQRNNLFNQSAAPF